MTRDFLRRRMIREVHIADFHTKLGEYLGKEPEGAALDIFLGKNHISALKSRNNCRDRRNTTAEAGCVRRAFETGDGPVKQAKIGIPRARVVEPVRVTVFECRREPDRRGHRPGIANEITPRMNRACFETF